MIKFLKNNTSLIIKYKTISLLISFLLILPEIYAQTNNSLAPESNRANSKSCSLEKGLSDLYLKYPEKKEAAIKNNLKLLLKVDSVIDYKKKFPGKDPQMLIPVVFHYFYDDCVLPDENEIDYYTGPLTDDRFINAIERLNNDFKGLTSNTCSAPECGTSSISFKLAEIDPDGNPTTGINRVISGLTYQGLSNEKTLKQKVQWERNKYMNIYVVERATVINNSGLAHYPTTSHNETNEEDNHLYDGPAMARWAIDPTNDRADYDYVLSHEVGHWLGLRHIWGSPYDGDYDGCECSMDDFDFYTDMVDEYESLFTNGATPNLGDVNDTPNTIGYSTREDNCNLRNTCNGLAADGPSCGSDATDGYYDYLQNVMDYTPCGAMFTPGQILFMEAVMRSDISERSELITNSDNAFYSNTNEARLVFTESTTFYESFANNGSFSNTLKMKLEGNQNVTFKNNLIGTEIATPYFNFNNLPSGLIAKVSILNQREAILFIEGVNQTNTDSSATFSFSSGTNNPFNSTLPIQNRRKIINFDFIEESGIVYHDIKSANSVGPLANSYQPFMIKSVNDIAKYYYLSSYKNQNNDDVFTIGVRNKAKAPVEIGLNADGTVKIYTKDQMINTNTNNYEYQYYPVDNQTPGIVHNDGDIYYKALDFNFATEFYIAIKIETCEQPYFGWLRFKYNSECNSLKVIDYAIKTTHIGSIIKAGELDEPTISFEAPIIKNSSTGEGYAGFEMELLNTATSQLTFKNNISNYFNIDNTDPNVGLTENDLTITKLDNFTAYVEPANTVFWQNNPNIEFEFDIEILGGGINGAPANFSKIANVEVTLSTANSEFSEKNKIVYQSNGYFAGVVRPNGDEIGIQYYSNEENSGYNVYAVGGINLEFACEPNTNIVALFDAGEAVNSNLNYKKAQAGRTSGYVLYEDELYIPQSTVDDLAVSTMYLAFKLNSNCKIFYGYIEITLNSDGTLTLNNYYLNLIEDEPTYTGFPKPNDCLGCIPSIQYLGDDVFYIEQFYINGTAQPLVGGVTLNSNHYSDYTIPYNDNSTPLNAVIDLSANLTHTFKIDLAGDYVNDDLVLYLVADATVWVDFNTNNCFESNEKIFSLINDQSGLSYLQFNYEFPEHLFGNYKMRVYAGLYPPNESGCGEATYGEFEDYTIHFLSACVDELLYDDTFYVPSGSFGAENIVINPNTSSVLFSGERSQMHAQKSICILPNTEVQYGSNFLAQIIDCGAGNLKQSKPALSNTNFKVYPNPFSQQSTIEFDLYNDSEISIFVSDITGKKLVTLSNKEQKTTGIHQVTFDAKGIAPGIYYCTLINGDKIETQKMVITK